MIKIENVETYGWSEAVRGMRNPMNSWDKNDSNYQCTCYNDHDRCPKSKYVLGPNDYDLMTHLCKAGTDHRKFMRMITVYIDITAPLYW